MHINVQNSDKEFKVFELKNDYGMEVHVLNFGGIIQKIMVPDKYGHLENVVLGYTNPRDYQTDPYFLGAAIGQVAGRIKEASFQIDEKVYNLVENEGRHHLHGGKGFHQVFWNAEPIESQDHVSVKLSYYSPDGENGYPGNVNVTITYALNNHNQLIVDYLATSDKATPVSLTNHTYFNLCGNLKNSIMQHMISINSREYLELNKELIPTGKVKDVKDGPFNFMKGRKLKDGIQSDFYQNEIVGNGYDHYFLFNENEKGYVQVIEESSGRVLQIETDQPGMIMYTGNNLEEGTTLAEGPSEKYLGVCFETQGSSASLHLEKIPSIILKKGEEYKKRTVYSFAVQ